MFDLTLPSGRTRLLVVTISPSDRIYEVGSRVGIGIAVAASHGVLGSISAQLLQDLTQEIVSGSLPAPHCIRS